MKAFFKIAFISVLFVGGCSEQTLNPISLTSRGKVIPFLSKEGSSKSTSSIPFSPWITYVTYPNTPHE
jgi:hypothetical protein